MASKRRIRRRSCESKVRHATAQAAQKVLNYMKKQYTAKLSLEERGVYHCQFCGGWHFGRKKLVEY